MLPVSYTVMRLVEYMYNFRITMEVEVEVEKLVGISLKSFTKRNTRQRDVSNRCSVENHELNLQVIYLQHYTRMFPN